MLARSRQAVKQVLRRFNRQIVYWKEGTLSGIDLVHDLQIVVARDNPLCLDVGANEGQTIDLLRRAWPAARIHAFEPSPRAFEVLRQKHPGSDVVLHHYALGQAPATQTLICYDRSDLSSFLPIDTASRPFGSVGEVARETVQVRTIDEVLEAHGLDGVDLLKVDTQGTDLDVLKGADKALRSGALRAILVELNFARVYRRQADPLEVIAFLRDRRYDLVDLYEKVLEDGALAWCTALFRFRGER